MIETLLLYSFVIFFANFTHTVAGFGMAMVAMPLLTAGFIPVHTAAPLIALVGLVGRPLLITHYRAALNVRAIWPLLVSSSAGIPLGVLLLQNSPGYAIQRLLGVVVVLYALINLTELYIPEMKHRLWAWVLGFIGGILGGAYNVAAPPVVIWSIGQRWDPETFKANMQTFAQMNSIIITLAHAGFNTFTTEVVELWLLALPAMLAGLLLGFRMDGRINRDNFRRIVLAVLLLTGLRLLF